MKYKKLVIIYLAVMSSIFIYSCEKEEEGENETKVSTYSSSESHNNGMDCMSCHVSGGEGEGWFVSAGSVYDTTKVNPYPGATVKLYTGPNGTGTLKATFQVDKKGNFYSTSSLDFGSGLYPAVEGNIETKYMSSSISKASCNSCHGVSTDKIWTK